MLDAYIAQYGRRLYGLCFSLCKNRCDADDLYQETWLRCCAAFPRYDRSQPFEPWLTRICVNCYRDVLRRQKRSPVTDAFATTEEKDRLLEGQAAAEREDLSYVREAVDALPDKLRLAVVLHYFHDMDVALTAKALGVPQGTVKSRLSRARKQLKEVLGHDQSL